MITGKTVDKAFLFKTILIFFSLFPKFLAYIQSLTLEESIFLVTVDKNIIFILYGYIAVFLDNTRIIQPWKSVIYSRMANRKKWIQNIIKEVVCTQIETLCITLFSIFSIELLYNHKIFVSVNILYYFLILFVYLLMTKLLFLLSFVIIKQNFCATILPFLVNTLLLLWSRWQFTINLTNIYIFLVFVFGCICISISLVPLLLKSDIALKSPQKT